ncbi:hypothetical protein O3M35_010987 [Rhynocoris fuscipes]|uniref:Uncharacterized protein n=1 Tax=Rhynocoris fuscipes TaxID=488301 RepID=A0AAW1D8Q4_9HEMI
MFTITSYIAYSLLLFNVFIYHSDAGKLPKSWKTCKLTDPMFSDCITTSIEGAVKDLANGNPSLGVLPLDPLRFNKISIDQGSGPVSIKLDLKDLDVIGIKTVKLSPIKQWNWKDALVEGVVPQIVLDGKYNIDGKVLVLPIKGEGHCHIVLDNVAIKVMLKLKTNEVGGKKYYQFSEFDFSFTTSKVHYQFDNLFNGDKALGETTNKFLNENWSQVINELKPAIFKAFSVAFKSIGDSVFSKVPADEINVV